MSAPHYVKVNIPSKGASKSLALQSCSTGRKLVVSSNFLPLFGFHKGVEVVEEVIGENKGLIVRLAQEDDFKTKKVYERSYKTRRNNPLEVLLDIRSQKLLNEAFPKDTQHIHVVFMQGIITLTPIENKAYQRIRKAKESKEPLSVFVACSSGVDALCLQKEGFKISSLLEWRPTEKRDKSSDFTESGALTALANCEVENLINEDIGEVDLQKLVAMTAHSEHTLFHCSLSCDDFSVCKAKSLKERALEDLSTSSDMVYDALRIIETFSFPYVLIENTFGFMNSEMNALLETKLRKWKYRTHKIIAHSPDFGGKTGRKRYYLFATSSNTPFTWYNQDEGLFSMKKTSAFTWERDIVPYLDTLRDVTHSKSIQDGKKVGRLRVIDAQSAFSPTILKSHARMAKDSVVVEHEGRYLFPDNAMLKRLMGIPQSFNVSCVGKTIESEILGQSIDWEMHKSIIQSVKRHIEGT